MSERTPLHKLGEISSLILESFVVIPNLHVTRFKTQKILRPAHTVYLCVVHGSQNSVFPYTALTD